MANNESERPTTFRDDAPSRCPTCGASAKTAMTKDGKQAARCGAGHEWEPEAQTLRLGRTGSR